MLFHRPLFLFSLRARLLYIYTYIYIYVSLVSSLAAQNVAFARAPQIFPQITKSQRQDELIRREEKHFPLVPLDSGRLKEAKNIAADASVVYTFAHEKFALIEAKPVGKAVYFKRICGFFLFLKIIAVYIVWIHNCKFNIRKYFLQILILRANRGAIILLISAKSCRQ